MGKAIFQVSRSIGKRATNRKSSGVRRAHGSQSRIPGRTPMLQGPPVSIESLAPRTKAIIPHPAKDKIQPFNKEANPRVNFVRHVRLSDTPDARVKFRFTPSLPIDEAPTSLGEVVNLDEPHAGSIVRPH